MRTMHDMPKPTIPHREVVQSYYLSPSRTLYITEEETSFPDGCLITSHTDLDGIIKHANNSFVQMSGWSREEIIGQPHEILRHPDMPKAAFAGLWETVTNGKRWTGYVKNLRKDGGFYWVFATIVPSYRNGQVVGYTSVRRKPARSKVEEMQTLYAQMLNAE